MSWKKDKILEEKDFKIFNSLLFQLCFKFPEKTFCFNQYNSKDLRSIYTLRVHKTNSISHQLTFKKLFAATSGSYDLSIVGPHLMQGLHSKIPRAIFCIKHSLNLALNSLSSDFSAFKFKLTALTTSKFGSWL